MGDSPTPPTGKTAYGGSSMVGSQNCKPWQFYGHFLEFMCIVAIQMQTLAVLRTLFGHLSHLEDFA